MKTFTKAPTAILDYLWDWTSWLTPGDTISTYKLTLTEGLIAVSDYILNLTTIVTWISGGTVNRQGVVTCEIITVAGRKDTRSAIFDMQPR